MAERLYGNLGLVPHVIPCLHAQPLQHCSQSLVREHLGREKETDGAVS